MKQKWILALAVLIVPICLCSLSVPLANDGVAMFFFWLSVAGVIASVLILVGADVLNIIRSFFGR